MPWFGLNERNARYRDLKARRSGLSVDRRSPGHPLGILYSNSIVQRRQADPMSCAASRHDRTGCALDRLHIAGVRSKSVLSGVVAVRARQPAPVLGDCPNVLHPSGIVAAPAALKPDTLPASGKVPRVNDTHPQQWFRTRQLICLEKHDGPLNC